MKWAIGKPLRIDQIGCVPVVSTEISVSGTAGFVSGTCQKCPLAILIFVEEQILGFDMDGRPYDRDGIERLYPNAIQMAVVRMTETPG